MRQFELVEGSSSKFWEVELDGLNLTVRFGRIGTAGQTKTKTFSDAMAARKEHDKLLKEKVAKGYAEAGGATGNAPVAVPARQRAAAPPPSVAAVAQAAAVPLQSVPLPTVPLPTAPLPIVVWVPAALAEPVCAAITWPQGGFDWTEELLARVPVVRGLHVPVAKPFDAVAAWRPLVLDLDQHGFITSQFALVAAAAGRSWAAWGPERSAALTSLAQISRADREFWLQLCTQSALAADKQPASTGSDELPFHERYYVRRGLQSATHAGIALHGLPFMIDVALELAAYAMGGAVELQVRFNHLELLRRAIAQAEDEVHDAALAAAQALRGCSPLSGLVSCFLFPHRQDWALECIADGLDDRYHLLNTCVLPVTEGLAVIKAHQRYQYHYDGDVMLQLRLHDEAVAELLEYVLAKAADKAGLQAAITLLKRMRSARSIRTLAAACEGKEVRTALDELSADWPAAVLFTVVEQAFKSRSRLIEGWAVRMALRRPDVLAPVMASLAEPHRVRLQELLAALNVEEVPAAALPPLLREPPWLRKARATELPTLALDVPTLPDRIDTPADVKAREAALQPSSWRINQAPAAGREKFFLSELMITAAGQARVCAGQPLQPSDIAITQSYWHGMSAEVLLLLPEATALAVWNSYPAQHWHTYDDAAGPVRAMLARYGTAAIAGLVRFTQSKPLDGLAIALDVDSPRLVPTALHALRSLKKAQPAAITWLRAHAETAIAVALACAFGPERLDRAERDDARYGLRWFVAQGFEPSTREIAARGAPGLLAALQALLDADPLLVLPSRLPKLPAFFVPASFRRPELKAGGVIGAEAASHIGTMLAISRIEAPYAGIELLRQLCTAESLAEFAWDIFEAWLAAGAPSKEGWAFAALGLLGNDETARRLAPRIREWPGEAAHLRAVAGLDLLAAIGTDVALMHLNGIAGKVKFKALQDRAREKIESVAEARGLTGAELADRLVPDLGLDDDGTLRLDFGPRQFVVAFDETLKPFVKDAQGVRLKDLPKPIRSDDAALAQAATERFKQVKKDAKAVASLQVTRLELAMIDRRRWAYRDFRTFFLEQPLMRHLTTRLVWGVYDGDTMLRAVRVAEDFTLADAKDELATLADEAVIGIAHVLEMPEPLRAAFGQVFADYEILQPFRQLGRETYALTPDELRSHRIERFKSKTVATGSVLGLVNRGWQRGQAQDAGFVGWFSKPVGAGLEVHLEIVPGTVVGDPSFEPKQTLPAIELRRSGTWDNSGFICFDTLHPIIASEVLRDVDLLAPLKE